ncbi:MAG: acetyl-CoA carboxylase biotin carboxyl carrier protein subunit [Lachnospiraceae bacterium]|jgi:biotin carboxyl carrier protein|nr:acetyl-CoA carboxylase biotin carboxyl carrier protein subunit [Lachnospiraceae bacterium]
MKSYTVTVNGVTYDVTVEENNGLVAPQMSAPRRQPVMPTKEAPKASGSKGAKAVTAGAAGKILKIEVKIGDTVKAGQSVAMLEVMKMETPIVTSEDGVVASIEIKEGDNVEAGATLITLN